MAKKSATGSDRKRAAKKNATKKRKSVLLILQGFIMLMVHADWRNSGRPKVIGTINTRHTYTDESDNVEWCDADQYRVGQMSNFGGAIGNYWVSKRVTVEGQLQITLSRISGTLIFESCHTRNFDRFLEDHHNVVRKTIEQKLLPQSAILQAKGCRAEGFWLKAGNKKTMRLPSNLKPHVALQEMEMDRLV